MELRGTHYRCPYKCLNAKYQSSSPGPATADNFSYLVNHLQSRALSALWLQLLLQAHITIFCSFEFNFLFCIFCPFRHRLSGLPIQEYPEVPRGWTRQHAREARWWMDEKLLWSCPTWIIVLSVDNPLFVSSWHPTKSVSPTKKSEGTLDGRWWSEWERGGMWGHSLPASFRERTYLKGMLCALSLSLSLSLSLPNMKNENYKGDNNKNSRMSGQAGAVHYSQLLWAAW